MVPEAEGHRSRLDLGDLLGFAQSVTPTVPMAPVLAGRIDAIEVRADHAHKPLTQYRFCHPATARQLEAKQRCFAGTSQPHPAIHSVLAQSRLIQPYHP